MQEILSDERVQRAREAGRGGRVRDEEETAAASSLTQVGDGREQASTGNGAGPGNQNGAPADGESAETSGEATAREWIENWREKQKVTAGSK